MIEILSSLPETIAALEDGDPDLKRAHLGNALSVIKGSLPENSWVGIYYDNGRQLILDAFQGTPACESIAYGKGVVGQCFSTGQAIAVEDVTAFPGYICCDEAAKSELCVPIFKGNKIQAILDIDRPDHHDFKPEIKTYEDIAKILANWL